MIKDLCLSRFLFTHDTVLQATINQPLNVTVARRRLVQLVCNLTKQMKLIQADKISE